jgi:uncharacterized membrane protein
MTIMKNSGKVFWITSTAIFIALLVVVQTVTSAFGNQLVTGSVNNLLMIVSVMTLGLASGVTVAVTSPILAKLLGIGPLWSLVPFIIAGNVTLILIWHFIGSRKTGNGHIARIAALVCAAAGKFLVLYAGIVRIAVPVLLGLPEQQAAAVSNMFSIPQLFTALIGGALAAAILPVLQKAIKPA